MTQMIEDEVKELRRFMREVIDTMLRQFGRSEPQFYSDYRNARRIVKTGSRKRKDEGGGMANETIEIRTEADSAEVVVSDSAESNGGSARVEEAEVSLSQ